MKKLLLVLFVALVTQLQAQNYCDSLEISMNCPPNSFAEFSVNLASFGFSGVTYDWTLTDELGNVINSSTTATAVFSLPNAMNSDTNYICLMSLFSAPAMTFACITCDTIVWNGTNWVLLSMMPPPCNLTGGSVYIDYTSAPWMMNASVNGMSMYDYSWTDTNGLVISTANQTPFYTQWSVTIIDNITGCDTTIFQDCTPSNAMCGCIMIYMPVCGCDGVMYSNSCIADCADVPWTPAVSNGMPGGFLPCTQPSTCEVEIDGDSIICTWGSPLLLTASPSALSNPFVSYLWSNGQAGQIVTINSPGTYCVIATDSTGCTDSACFTVSFQDLVIYSAPSPTDICLGDSIVMWLNPVLPVTNIIWVPTGTTATTIVESPTASTTYIVEALDANGCDRRGEIFVSVYPETPLNPLTAPNPPMVCLGDSVVIEVNSGFLNYWWNTGNPLDQDEDRVVIFPTQDFTYVVEALDANGCESREEIEVFVDTCATGIINIMSAQVIIFPNPAKGIMTISLPEKEMFDLVIFDVMGRLVLSENKVAQTYIIPDNTLAYGSYILNLSYDKGVITRKLLIE